MPMKLFSTMLKRISTVVIGCFILSLSVYGQDTARVVIGRIEISGNKVTKEGIILRELTFHEGDTVSRKDMGRLLENNRQNLMNAALFNFAEIDTARAEDNPEATDVHVKVTERWYTWPFPIFQFGDQL